MRPTATAWDTALRVGQRVRRLRPPRRRRIRDGALRARRRRARGLPAGRRRSARRRPRRRPGDGRLLLDHRLRRRRRAPAARGPRRQLPRLGRRARGHRARACRRSRSPTSRPERSAPSTQVLAALLERERTGRGARLVVSMTHRSHDLVAHRLGGEPVPRHAHRRARLLPHLRHRRRPPPHRRRARAEVLPTRLCELVERTRPRRAPVRRGSGGARARSSRRSSRRAPSPTGSSTSATRTSASARSERAQRRPREFGSTDAPAEVPLGAHTEAWRARARR